MLVFKFGGASVKNADAVHNLGNIVKKYSNQLVVVVSAMAKTTNALENVIYQYFNQSSQLKESIKIVRDYHYSILKDLFPDDVHPVYNEVEKQFKSLEKKISDPPGSNYDFEYDQIVCYGELISTIIVSQYLSEQGINNRWIDIRDSLRTDQSFREAKVNWDLSRELVLNEFHFRNEKVVLTQGFIASAGDNKTTSLGREGSDYTAAILAYILGAEMVIIWKDVPGVLNADPKWFDNTILLNQLNYKDAIELAYYGASVIHPKTIQPLKNKNINLYVKSFIHPDEPGTLIGNEDYDKLIPSFIFKMDQVLISISSKDFSFIAEDNLELILGVFAKFGLRMNLMQNTAVSFQVCINNDKTRIPSVVRELEYHFNVSWENGLELITIRYYDEDTIKRVLVNKDKILEQRSRTIIQMVVKDRG